MKARNLPITSNTLALWTFENTTNDLVQGISIQGSYSTPYYTELLPGVFGLAMCTGSKYYTPITPSLQILGDMTIEMLLRMRLDTSPSTFVYFSCSPTTGSETEAKNVLFQLQRDQYEGFHYFSESGAGVNFLTNNWPIAPLHGKTQLISFTRKDGIGTLYIDGVSYGDKAIDMASGGTSSRFMLGGQDSEGPGFGTVGSLRIENRARTANEIKIDYNWTLGRYYGVLT